MAVIQRSFYFLNARTLCTIFHSHLKFSKIKGDSEPYFARNYALPCLSNVDNIKTFHRAVFEIQALKTEIKGFLAGHSVAIVTYCVTKIIPTCSPMIGQFFDTMIVVSTDKEW